MVNNMVNGFFNVTGFSQFAMVNASLVCCVSNGGRMKAKFTVVRGFNKISSRQLVREE